MLAKRIIPCLDVKDGRVVKGTNFVSLRDAGDPVELASLYEQEQADELVFLDITASLEKRKSMVETIERTAREVFMPLTVGGGIFSIEDMRAVLLAGADKTSLNTAAVKDPTLITRGGGSLREPVRGAGCGRQTPGRGFLGSVHQRRPHPYRAGCPGMGEKSRIPGGGGNPADQYGCGWHQGWVRYPPDPEGGRSGSRTGDCLRGCRIPGRFL